MLFVLTLFWHDFSRLFKMLFIVCMCAFIVVFAYCILCCKMGAPLLGGKWIKCF